MSDIFDIMNYERKVVKERVNHLVLSGKLIAICSYEQYEQTIKAVKLHSNNSFFSNCYLLRENVEQLIEQRSLFQIPVDNGVAFVSDEISYWKLFVYIDVNKPFHLPRLDKCILAELIYKDKAFDNRHKTFVSRICGTGFRYYETYQQIDCIPKMDHRQFEEMYNVAVKALEKENVSIYSPKDSQLIQFEEIYLQEMEIYSRYSYSIDERRAQRDKGLLSCVANSEGNLLAIGISPQIYGGVTAVKHEYASNIYAPALLLHGLLPYYSENNALSPKSNYGWIAKSNTSSNRLHKLVGMEKTGRSFSQYIMPGFLY